MADEVARLSTALADRYRVEREIGAGGMATVYRAEDLKHHRRVALKVLRPELGAVLGTERFLAEINVTANLQHPNLLPLFDSGEADGLLFYVMPFVEGESLRARLERERQLPVDEAIRIAVAVASALDYAHRHGVIHRDLKPENILLHEGQPLVTDFGIALAVSNAGGARVTQTGLSLGTPQYMSPEQATGDRVIDGRSDIYSLAAVLHEMLTGDPPYPASTTQAVIAKVLTEPPPKIRSVRAAVPEHVEDAVQHALQKLAADRFATAREFADALTHARPAPHAIGAQTAPALRIGNFLRQYAPWTVAALLALVIVASGPRLSRASAPVVVRSSLLPPRAQEFSEAESFGALSPDGTRFVFVTLGRLGETQLWMRSLDDAHAEPLGATEGAAAPFWSPDGTQVGFFAQGALRITDAAGSVRSICDVPGAFGGAWGSRNLIAIATGAGIVSANVDTRDCKMVVARVPGIVDLRVPTMLPDGRHVLFTLRNERMNIAVADLTTGRVEIVMTDASAPTFVAPDILLFARGTPASGAHLHAQRFDPRRRRLRGSAVRMGGPVRTAQGVAAYAAAANTLIYLATVGDIGKLLVSRSGAVLDSIGVPTVWTHQWSHTGEHVALAGGTSGLVLYDVARRRVEPFASQWWISYPTWLPGDSVIAFAACDVVTLWSCGIATANIVTNEETVLIAAAAESIHRLLPSSVSPDGRYIVYTRALSFDPHGAEIWLYDRAERVTRRLVARPPAGALEGAISPDGKWLAYRSNELGTWEVFVRPFGRSGTTRRVSLDGGRLPRWRRDGRELFYQSPDGDILAVDVQSSDNTFSHSPPRVLFAAPAWSRHNFYDIGTSYDVSPDGQRFTVRITPTGDAVLVQNWQTLLQH